MRTPMSRDTILVAFSGIARSAMSVLLGLLILRCFSDPPILTDALFLAYAVFGFFVTFSVPLRISVGPMLRCGPGHAPSPERYAGLAATVILAFALAALVVAALALPFGHLLAYHLSPEGKRLTALFLAAFAPVIFLQGIAQFLSGVLGTLGRFVFVSVTIAAVSVAGLAVFVASARMGPVSVVFGLLALNGLHVALQSQALRRIGLRFSFQAFRSLRPRAFAADVAEMARCSAVYVPLPIAYVIGQSLTTSLAPGTPTAYAYAHTLITIAIANTTGAMGITLLNRYCEFLETRPAEFSRFVINHAVMATLINSAVLGLLVVLALPAGIFLFEVAASAGADPALRSLQVIAFTRSLWCIVPGAWAWGILAILAPAVVAARRNRGFVPYTVLFLAVHFVLSLLLRRVGGLAGIGLAFSITSFLFAGHQALRLRRIAGPEFLSETLRRCAVVAMSASTSALAGIAAFAALVVRWRWGWSWIVSAAVSAVVFCVLFLVLAILLERNACRDLLSHFLGRAPRPSEHADPSPT